VKPWNMIAAAVAIGAIAIILICLNFNSSECNKAGGTLVRTSFGYECLRAEVVRP